MAKKEILQKYNELLRLQERIFENRCPDGRLGCLVAHDMESIVDALQQTLKDIDALKIDWRNCGFEFNETARILNDNWQLCISKKCKKEKKNETE